MHPETLPAIVATFAGFVLKTSLGFCVCWAISKAVVFPGSKFLVWLGFLVGATSYWLWLAASFVLHSATLAPRQSAVALALAAPLGKWQIQPSWALPLSIALRSLGVLYLLVLGRLLFTRIRKQVHLRWILRFAYRAPERVENSFQPIAESLGVSNVRLLMLSGIHSPATFGWIRPTVLLPPFCLEQDPSELRDILRHELQHIRRRDFVSNTVASLCRALLFFHPAVWYAMYKLEMESELACDLAVVSDSPERRATYAECLVRFARLNASEGPKPWNLDFAGSSIQLQVRIGAVLAETKKIPEWLLGLRATLGVLLIAGFLILVPSLFIRLSYKQHRIAQSVQPTVLATHADVRPQRRSTHKVRLQRQEIPTSRPFATSAPAIPTAVPAEAAVDAASVVVPPTSDVMLSSEPRPALKRRSNLSEIAAPPRSAPATTIPLSNPRSSHPLITKGRSVASAILAGASQIAHIAHESRDGGNH